MLFVWYYLNVGDFLGHARIRVETLGTTKVQPNQTPAKLSS